jgi:hypothetical protein
MAAVSQLGCVRFVTTRSPRIRRKIARYERRRPVWEQMRAKVVDTGFAWSHLSTRGNTGQRGI